MRLVLHHGSSTQNTEHQLVFSSPCDLWPNQNFNDSLECEPPKTRLLAGPAKNTGSFMDAGPVENTGSSTDLACLSSRQPEDGLRRSR
ncbi:hypothetical protein NDU88_009224 [Pleurodeles waltl]|uniref:Uncharacterized protein n=1 Tax=Pleurodeles waltl TaxID=8319 RepID=A0AAV7RYF6_PLEWA|nr:hypothetical protein NDU88_009224 [Pleurodeles waltl]